MVLEFIEIIILLASIAILYYIFFDMVYPFFTKSKKIFWLTKSIFSKKKDPIDDLPVFEDEENENKEN